MSFVDSYKVWKSPCVCPTEMDTGSMVYRGALFYILWGGGECCTPKTDREGDKLQADVENHK